MKRKIECDIKAEYCSCRVRGVLYPAWWITGPTGYCATFNDDLDDASKDLKFARQIDCERAIQSLVEAGYGTVESREPVTIDELRRIAVQDLAW